MPSPSIGSISVSDENIQNTAKLLQNVAKELYVNNLELNKERARIDEILFQIGEVVFAIDQDHKVTLFNSTAEEVFGITKEEIIGKKADKHILIYKGHQKEPLKSEQYAFNKKNNVFERVNVKIGEKDENDSVRREYFTLRSTYVEFNDNKREAVISMSNITHEVELDQQKDEFISIASHELKTPIAIVNNNLWMLKNTSRKKYSKREQHFIDEMSDGLHRLQNIINNLLNVSRIQQGRLVFEIQKKDIYEMTDRTISHFTPIAERKKLKLIPPKKHKASIIETDIDKYHEIMDNLLSNAIKYTQTGSISIEIEQPNHSKFYKISISDTGPGIPKKDYKKIFTKFGRTEQGLKLNSPGASTGLGLYICKQFVIQMGGEIGFTSQMGKGTTFWFTLPKQLKIESKPITA